MPMGGCGTSRQASGAGLLFTAVPGETELVSITKEDPGIAISVSKVIEGTEKARAGFRENSQ